MAKIQIFNFEEKQVRTVVVDNSPFFVAKDVAEILGYQRPDNAIRNHVDEDDKLMHQISASGQNRNMTVINESGVYALIFSSKLPSSQKFKRWVTSEVLPSIRKHGAYMTTETIEQVLADPDTIIKIATNLKLEQQRRLAAEQAVVEANQIIEAQQPKVLFADSVEASDRNLPTQKSMNLELFEIKETTINHTNGISIARTAKVTGKGQVYFINKLKGSVTV